MAGKMYEGDSAGKMSKKERDQVASSPMLAEMTTVSNVINTGEIRELKGTAGKRKHSMKWPLL